MTVKIAHGDLALAGGTIVAAIEELTKRGVDHNLLRVVSLMAGNELCQFVSVCDPYIDCHMLISYFCICSGLYPCIWHSRSW
jgi:uracil phosphoribosyltransferase